MARVNVYLPDRLAEAVRAGGVNLSNITQVAVERELALRSTSSWLRRVALQRAAAGLTHAAVFGEPAPAPALSMETADGIGDRGPDPAAVRVRTSHVVVDASAVLDLMVSIDMGPLVESAVSGCVLHAPAGIDARVLAVLGRLEHEGLLRGQARDHAETLAAAPIERHALAGLIAGAWRRRAAYDVDRAFSMALSSALPARLIATGAAIRPGSSAGLVAGSAGSGAA